jgi:polysaccharide export outer membrane protein
VNKKQRRYNIILFLFIVFIISPSFFVLAEELSSSSDESDIKMEQRVIQDAEEQKQLQLKEYFRVYYYRQGKYYFKKGEYNNAIVKLEKALSWDPGYEPAMKMLKLSKIKITAKLTPQERNKAMEEIKKESHEVKIQKTEVKEEVVIPKEETQESVGEAKVISPEPASGVLYRIDKEDVLEVTVWRHPELSKEVIVRPDGMISFPLVTDIQAMGLTITELKEKITQGLSEFAKKRLRPAIAQKPEEKAEYLIGPGDTLDISVWKVDDLSRKVIVRPDGKISYPLIGDIQATGKTLTQLDEELTHSLSSYVKEPQVSVMVESFGWKKEVSAEVFLEESPEVSVMIKKFGGRKVIVLGDVKNPGVYTFTGDIRLIEALALAGDCTKFAVKNNILIIRGDIHNNPQVISANIAALLKNAKLSENALIQPQDVIFVPRSLIGNINAFVETLSPWLDLVYKGTTTKQAIEGVPQ